MTFRKGQSGNPAGRKPGTVTTPTKIRQQIDAAFPNILQKVIEQAENGDMTAAKILIDRICPTLKPQSIPIRINIGGNLSETGGNILDATLSGQISPDTGAALISALSHQVKILEADEILRRLAALEDVQHKKSA